MEWATLREDAVQAVADTLEAALSTLRVQCLTELSDGIQDMPLVQVHWESDNFDPAGNSGQTSFRGGMKQIDLNLELLGFVHPRSIYGEDVEDATQWADRVAWVLMSQDTDHYGTTGSPSLKTQTVSTKLTTWDLGNNGQAIGFITSLTLRVY